MKKSENIAFSNNLTENANFDKIETNSNFLSNLNNESTQIIRKKSKNKFLSLIQKDANFFALVKKKLNDEDLKEITKKKLSKNMSCNSVNNLLSKCDQLLYFIENQQTYKTLTHFLTSLGVIKNLLNKILDLEKGNGQQKINTYSGSYYL